MTDTVCQIWAEWSDMGDMGVKDLLATAEYLKML